MMRLLFPILFLLAGMAAPARSQGHYAGIEGGAIEHHITLATTGNGQTSEKYHKNWGLGGGVFVGTDVDISPGFRIGAEASATLGGDDIVVAVANGGVLSLAPRYGYRLAVRGGPTLGGDTFLYLSAGYGGNRYRIVDRANVAGLEEWGSSFLVGAGIERRLSERVAIRLDYKHVDNQTHQIFVGVPVRF